MTSWLPEDVARMVAHHRNSGVLPDSHQHGGLGAGWSIALATEPPWIAEDEGWIRLRREAELIATLAAAGCRVPRVIGVDELARLQVRSILPGVSGYAIDSLSLVFGESVRPASVVRYQHNFPLTEAGRVLDL